MTISGHPKLVATIQRFGFVGFLIAHGIAHVGIWAFPRPSGQQRPFDPSVSWLLGSEESLAALLAIGAAVLLVAGGSLLWAGVPWWRPLAVLGLAVSFVLMSLFFNPWFLPIQVVNGGLIAGVLRGSWPATSIVVPGRSATHSRVLRDHDAPLASVPSGRLRARYLIAVLGRRRQSTGGHGLDLESCGMQQLTRC